MLSRAGFAAAAVTHLVETKGVSIYEFTFSCFSKAHLLLKLDAYDEHKKKALQEKGEFTSLFCFYFLSAC